MKFKDAIPIVAIEGAAFDCGREYAEFALSEFPDFPDYLRLAIHDWDELQNNAGMMKLFERGCPHIIDVLRGMALTARGRVTESEESEEKRGEEGCTSFFASGSLTVDGDRVTGQNKDTPYQRADLYVILRMRVKGAIPILTLAYPGELLGYGMWGNGAALFRNSLNSSAEAQSGLSMRTWGMLALAANSVGKAVDLGETHGIKGAGNVLYSDSNGNAVSVEFNAGGVEFVYPKDGILTHANHPVGMKTAVYEHYPDPRERENSRYRELKLEESLADAGGKLTPKLAENALADHSAYPRGVCRHVIGDKTDWGTTAAIVAEPAKGVLNVTKGNPCENTFKRYSLSDRADAPATE